MAGMCRLGRAHEWRPVNTATACWPRPDTGTCTPQLAAPKLTALCPGALLARGQVLLQGALLSEARILVGVADVQLLVLLQQALKLTRG